MTSTEIRKKIQRRKEIERYYIHGPATARFLYPKRVNLSYISCGGAQPRWRNLA